MTKRDYHVPQFRSLDTNVKELLLSYLQDFGMDYELFAFITGITVDKMKDCNELDESYF